MKKKEIILNEGTESQENLSVVLVDDIEEYAKANHYITSEEFIMRMNRLV